MVQFSHNTSQSNPKPMVRTQMYVDAEIHRDLIMIAKAEDKSMAEVAREILKEGVAKRKNFDTSGKKVLQKLLDMHINVNDPYLSENIDHYLYGAPKKQP